MKKTRELIYRSRRLTALVLAFIMVFSWVNILFPQEVRADYSTVADFTEGIAEGSNPDDVQASWNQAATLYAQYSVKPIDSGTQPRLGSGDPDPEYHQVKFDQGSEGTISGGSASYWILDSKANIEYVYTPAAGSETVIDTSKYQLPGQSYPTEKSGNAGDPVTYDSSQAPKLLGFEFDTVDIPTGAIYEDPAGTTIKVKYNKLDSTIEKGSGTSKPEGYKTVKFEQGNHGSLTGETEYYVNPEEGKTLGDIVPPSISPDTGYKIKTPSWDPNYVVSTAINRSSPDEQVFTAQYEEDLVTINFIAGGSNVTNINPSSRQVKRGTSWANVLKPAVDIAAGYKIKDYTLTSAGGPVVANTEVFNSDTTDVYINSEKDPSKWVNLTVATNSKGQLRSSASPTIEVLKTDSWANIKSQAAGLVEALANNKLGNWSLTEDNNDPLTSTPIRDSQTFASDTTVYANYVRDDSLYVNIKFRPDDGGKVSNISVADQDVLKSQTLASSGVSAPGTGQYDIARGYRVSGWKDGVTDFAGSITPTQDMTFKAQVEVDQSVNDFKGKVNYYVAGTTDPVPGISPNPLEVTGYIGQAVTVPHPTASTGYRVLSGQPTSITINENNTASVNVYYEKLLEQVTYKFESEDPSLTLPAGVRSQLPNAVYNGVTMAQVGTTVPTVSSFNDVRVSNGTWSFVAWDRTGITVTEGGGPYDFTGTWRFTEDPKADVKYKFVSQDTSLSLPVGVRNQKPADQQIYVGRSVTPTSSFTPVQDTVNGEDGSWTFVNWRPASLTVASGNTNEFVGTWKWNPQARVNVTYRFESITPGKDLPTSGLPALPANRQVLQGARVPVPANPNNFRDAAGNGTWIFVGWQPGSDQTAGTSDINFVGQWRYEEDSRTPSTIRLRFIIRNDDNKKGEFEKGLMVITDAKGNQYIKMDVPRAYDAKKLSKVVPKILDKAGYRFQGWNKAFEGELTQDTDFYADFKTRSGGGTTVKPVPVPVEPEYRDIERISGDNRVGTAIEVSKKNFDEAKHVIVVDSSNFPDALTASVLAHELGGPILLTDSNKLDDGVRDEIARLGADQIVIVGGTNSISEGVRNELTALDVDSVQRIAGANRYETSALVAKEVNKLTGVDIAMIASGENFPDALSSAPLAIKEKAPILLVAKDRVDDSVKAAIGEIGISNFYLAGGENAVSKDVEKALAGKVKARFAGADRYETALLIAKYGFKDAEKAYLASGESFPDALVIGHVAGANKAPILLSPRNGNQAVADYIKDSKIKNIIVVGGENTISEKAVEMYKK